jgi:hypothetical protein
MGTKTTRYPTFRFFFNDLARKTGGNFGLGRHSARRIYARENAVTLNTVYTHLRRIKEKTGCTRIAKLSRMLNELQMPLRLD